MILDEGMGVSAPVRGVAEGTAAGMPLYKEKSKWYLADTAWPYDL